MERNDWRRRASTKTALVTGISDAPARSAAAYLASRGYDVAITDPRKERLDEFVGQLQRFEVRVLPIAADVGSESERKHIRDRVQAFGRLDVLVIDVNGGIEGRISERTGNWLDDVNCGDARVSVEMVQELLPLLKEAGGLVINIARRVPARGDRYGLQQAALEAATRALAERLRGYGVGIVTVDRNEFAEMIDEMEDPEHGAEAERRGQDASPLLQWLIEQPPLRVSGARYYEGAGRRELESNHDLVAIIRESTAVG